MLQILVWVMSFCLLEKVGGHREQPASSLQKEKKILLGTTAPTLFHTAREMRPEVFKLVCRAVGQHGICSSQNGMHSGVWRERMFGCKGFVYARSLAG